MQHEEDLSTSQESAEDNAGYLVSAVGFVIVLCTVWLGYWFVGGHRPEELAQFGDSFGAINTLFSGLAFAFFVYTVWQQQREIRLQINESKTTNRVLKSQLDNLHDQLKVVSRQAQIAETPVLRLEIADAYVHKPITRRIMGDPAVDLGCRKIMDIQFELSVTELKCVPAYPKILMFRLFTPDQHILTRMSSDSIPSQLERLPVVVCDDTQRTELELKLLDDTIAPTLDALESGRLMAEVLLFFQNPFQEEFVAISGYTVTGLSVSQIEEYREKLKSTVVETEGTARALFPEQRLSFRPAAGNYFIVRADVEKSINEVERELGQYLESCRWAGLRGM